MVDLDLVLSSCELGLLSAEGLTSLKDLLHFPAFAHSGGCWEAPAPCHMGLLTGLLIAK